MPGQYRADPGGIVWRVAGTWDDDVTLHADHGIATMHASEVEQWQLVNRHGELVTAGGAFGGPPREWHDEWPGEAP